MSEKINEVLSALIQEKKSIAAEVATVEKQRKRLMGTQKKIERAIAALSPKSESTAGRPLSRDAVREFMLDETKSNGVQSEQAIKRKIAAKLKKAGGSSAGLTKHIRAILAEPAFSKTSQTTEERRKEQSPS